MTCRLVTPDLFWLEDSMSGIVFTPIPWITSGPMAPETAYAGQTTHLPSCPRNRKRWVGLPQHTP